MFYSSIYKDDADSYVVHDLLSCFFRCHPTPLLRVLGMRNKLFARLSALFPITPVLPPLFESY